MAGAALTLDFAQPITAFGGELYCEFDASQLDKFIAMAELQARSPEPMLRRVGVYYVGETKRNFQSRGPGWPAKPARFESWEGGKTAPLTYKGRLAGSVTYDVQATDLRVGSPLPYAATHQFGSDGPRSFYLWIQPEYDGEPDPAHPYKNARRDAQGFLVGLIVPKRTVGALKQLVTITIQPRPFLRPPNPAQWGEIIRICQDFILGVTGSKGMAQA